MKEVMENEKKALDIANKQKKYYGNPQYEMRDENWSVHECYQSAMQAMQWKDEQYKEREEGLLETINALEIRLQKTQDSGMYFFDKYNVQKQQMIDKACKFLKSYRQDTPDGLGYFAGIVNDKTIEDFKKYMKGE